jgi:methyl-accepting chemotaxis protein
MKLTVGKKIGAGFITVVILMVASAVLTYFRISKIQTEESSILDLRFPLSVDCYELLTNLELTQTRARDAILTVGDKGRSEAARQSWEKQWAAVDSQMSKLQELKIHFALPENRERADKVKAAFPALRETQSKIFEVAASGTLASAVQARELLYTGSKPQNDAIKKTLHELIDSSAQVMADAAVRLKADSAVLILSLAISTTLAVIFATLIAVFLGRSISGASISALAQAEAIAGGDLSGEDLKLTSTDELADLTTAINKMQSKLRTIITSISNNAQQVAVASEEFSATSQQISANSEKTSAQVHVVSAASEQVNLNLQSVATATEQMHTSIDDIAKSATEAAKIAGEALSSATETNDIITRLGDSSAKIGQVIKVITSIAQQTNLLALNATIEAARAGEAGKGFAVVANEVKELAKQTAKATEDIGQRIAAIQSDASIAVDAIAKVAQVIARVSDISSVIAAAVEEQSATTSELSRHASDAAKGSGEVAENIGGVAQAAHSTSAGATQSQNAAMSLAQMSTDLRGLVAQFKTESNGHRPLGLQ